MRIKGWRFLSGLMKLLALVLCLSLAVCLAKSTSTKQTKKPAKRAAPAKVKPAAAKPKASAYTTGEDSMPRALANHLEKLRRAIPGNGGEPGGGPTSAEDEGFFNKAYPDTDIPIERYDAERSAFAALKGRNLPSGKGRPGTWVSVGPSNAQYQLTYLRGFWSYVPNEYAAGGRTTTLAISPNCVTGQCRMWAAPAGGGIWRAENALDGQPNWKYLANNFGINAAGSILVDPNDSTANTIWVGTGEANASTDSAAGVGLYTSIDGGDTWSGPLGHSVFNGRSIGSIAIASDGTLYVATTRGVRGVAATSGGAVSLIPGAPMWGLYKSTDGGASWTFIHEGSADVTACTNPTTVAGGGTPCSVRGVRRVAIDPSDPHTIYAASYGRGVWRSNDSGATWTQIYVSLVPTDANMRAEFAVNKTPDGKTRMYVGEGSSGSPGPYSRFFRAENVATGTPSFTSLTSNSKANPGYGSYNYCDGQCWYDNQVVSPAGYPDMVYLLGCYQYGETGGTSNGRAVVLSTDAGVSFTDMTMDATDLWHPNGLHPDEHFLVTNPSNPNQFFEAGDGGIMRSSGAFADASAYCDSHPYITSATSLARCKQLLSRIPTKLESMNKGLTTLQFQSLSVNPANSNNIQGGTQDNGTWETTGNTVKWLETMWGDGGFSGFDVADPQFRFHTYYYPSPDVNFSSGQTADWNWIGDPIYGNEPTQFYTPIISDPKVSGTMWAGTGHVWRTKTHGMGTMTLAEFRGHCNEFFGDYTVVCGDWVPLGDSSTAGYMGSSAYGTGKTSVTGSPIAQVRRSPADSATLWVATQHGRVFISKNADVEPASAAVFTRLDSMSSTFPGRYVSGIYVDPANANHAWISYSGFNESTPTMPGHVFEVTFNPAGSTVTIADRSYDLGNIALTDVAYDDLTGDLYVASDFGVFRLASGTTTWTLSAPGMPNVEVASLTIVPGARKLYAATHGLGAWLLNLP